MSLQGDLVKRPFSKSQVKALKGAFSKSVCYVDNSPLAEHCILMAQRQLILMNSERREHLMHYDNIIDSQRTTVYKYRYELLTVDSTIEQSFINGVGAMLKKIVSGSRAALIAGISQSKLDNNIFPYLRHEYTPFLNLDFPNQPSKIDVDAIIGDNLVRISWLFHQGNAILDKKLNGEPAYKIVKDIWLRNLDNLWRKHICRIGQINSGMDYRMEAGKDRLVEYKFAAFDSFRDMFVELEKVFINESFSFLMSQLTELDLGCF